MTLTEEAFKRSETLIAEINAQSDRGAAIVGVAWVEEELLAALQSFLEDDKKTQEKVFGRTGPLSNLSAKIDLARLLGMCSKVITSHLHVLRTIRNEFAHNIAAKDNTGLSFKSPHIAEKCFSLKCVAHESNAEPRHAFIRACAILNSDFYIHRFYGQKVSSGGLIHAKIENEI